MAGMCARRSPPGCGHAGRMLGGLLQAPQAGWLAIVCGRYYSDMLILTWHPLFGRLLCTVRCLDFARKCTKSCACSPSCHCCLHPEVSMMCEVCRSDAVFYFTI